MRRLAVLALAAGLLLAVCAGSASAASTKTWHVKVTNLTPGPVATAGQPMSPPLWAVHDKKLHMWQVGQLASSGLLPIDEDAVTAPLFNYLSSNSHVFATKVETGSPAGPIPPGGSREFDITSKGGKNYLSMAWMLVRTNDAFTGLDSYKLDQGARKKKGKGHKAAYKTRTVKTFAYDGGTENNNEDCAFIPGPPCNHPGVRDATAQAIARHQGLNPSGPLAAFAWNPSQPVAQIDITRTK